ncbi:MAG: HypC/HybG/HupF family hydrogenase formation chaperone [Bryobacterales bacterium]|nr:HypC/HybG/HupF family hydrogenase formation chaperone [Bryobacterales bacterium]
MCLAVPGELLEISGNDDLTRTGRVSFGGVIKEVSLAYTPEAKLGDYVLVHVGFAIQTINEDEARRTLALIRELQDAE